MTLPTRPFSDVPFASRPWLREPERCAVCFTTELPFEIPLGAGDLWTIEIEEANEIADATLDTVELELSTIERDLAFPSVFDRLPGRPVVLNQFRTHKRPAKRTRVAMRVRPSVAFQNDEAIFTRSFDQCLSALNRVLIEYSICTMDRSVAEVAKEDLPSVALFTFEDRVAPYRADQFMRLHWRDEIEKIQLASSVRERIVERLESPMHPAIATYHRQRVIAERLPDHGRYAESVMATSLAIEAAIAWALQRHSEEPGCDFRQPVDRILRGSIVRVVREHLGVFGGSWDVDDLASPPGRWRNDVADVRNRVAHEGMRPSWREAVAALDAGIDFSTYLFDQIGASGRESWLDEVRVGADQVVVGRFEWENAAG